MSLVDWIKKNYANYNLSDTNSEWRLFIKDHRQLIVENSSTYLLDADDNELYRFRPKEFLKANNIDPDIFWIVLWINQIYNEIEFNNIKELLIPRVEYIKSLYEQYRSFKANLQRSDI